MPPSPRAPALPNVSSGVDRKRNRPRDRRRRRSRNPQVSKGEDQKEKAKNGPHELNHTPRRRRTLTEDMSHTASKTWVSDETKEHEAFARIRENMSHIVPRSPFVPRTFTEWVAHRLESKEEDHKAVAKKIVLKEAKTNVETKVSLDPALGGKRFEDHRGCVLARESIWTVMEQPPPGCPQASWPTYDEMKHEGDDRNKSGYSRFPPLPRDPGNVTVNWKQRAPLKQSSFDRTGRPTMAEDEIPPETDERMLFLLGTGTLAGLDG